MRFVKTPPDLVETMISMKVELRSYRANNEKLIRKQEKQTELNVVLM
jgi:hypothetical protein